MKSSILPKFAFNILKEAETKYNETGSFSDQTLEELYNLFGEAFQTAAEQIDSSKIVEYQTQNGRRIFKVTRSKDQYTVYDNINFCSCDFFHTNVLDNQSSITCPHVLLVKLGQIMGKLKVETVTDEHFVDFLNDQMYVVKQYSEQI